MKYPCIVWAQNINTVKRLIIPHKKALRIMKFGDKITLENILYGSQSINRQLPSIFYD